MYVAGFPISKAAVSVAAWVSNSAISVVGLVIPPSLQLDFVYLYCHYFYSWNIHWFYCICGYAKEKRKLAQRELCWQIHNAAAVSEVWCMSL